MSRRQASSAGTVSLFPFLAVLVCAMGALILLLLVTTRRIRQQSLVENVSVQQGQEPNASTPPPASPGASGPQPAPHDPTPSLLDELATLEARQSALAAEVAQREQQLTRLQEDTAAHAAKLAHQQAAAAEHAAEKERLNNLYVRLRRQQDETEQRTEDLRKRIQQTRIQLAEADSKFAIIPYDGHSGTTRRPIIIECTADRMTFVSEGISLTPRDLNGFPQHYNPILAVTRGLIRHWERQLRSDPEIGKPYVMLVVRPGGATTYRIARKLLAPMGEPFGYELLTDGQQFAWPPGDPKAIDGCRRVIDTMLDERDSMLRMTLRNGGEVPTYGNDEGQFASPEFKRLIQAADGFVLGSSRRAVTSALTPEDRLTEWLAQRSATPESPAKDRRSTRITDIDPFADLADPLLGHPPAVPDGDPHVSVPASPFDTAATQTAPTPNDRTAPPTRDAAGTPWEPAPLDPSQPQWGPRSGSGVIGFEKQVRVTVTETQITIGEENTIPCGLSTPAAELKRLVVDGLNREVRSWGPPPKSFYWMPSVRFAVAPGGRVQYQRLKKIISEWDVQASVEYANE